MPPKRQTKPSRKKREDATSSSSDSDDHKKGHRSTPSFQPYENVYSLCLEPHEDASPICRIGEGDEPKYLYLRYGSADGMRSFSLPHGATTKDGLPLCLYPTLSEQRAGSLTNKFASKMFVAGATLCGKSFLGSKIARCWLATHPKKHRIILVSALAADPAWDNIEKIVGEERFLRLPVDEETFNEENPISLADLRGDPDKWSGALVVFDDHLAASSSKATKCAEKLKDRVLMAGRHLNLALIILQQQMLNSAQTRTTLTNVYQVVGFASSASRHHLIGFMERYMALPKEQIAHIMGIPSRWILLNRVNPMYVLHEKGCFLL